MIFRNAAIAVLALSLSACVTLYSKEREWKLPAGMGHYLISARLNAGLLTREAVISVNGQEVLRGSAFFWSNTITMSSTFEQLPIDALCDREAKTCDVRIAGIHAASLKF